MAHAVTIAATARSAKPHSNAERMPAAIKPKKVAVDVVAAAVRCSPWDVSRHAPAAHLQGYRLRRYALFLVPGYRQCDTPGRAAAPFFKRADDLFRLCLTSVDIALPRYVCVIQVKSAEHRASSWPVSTRGSLHITRGRNADNLTFSYPRSLNRAFIYLSLTVWLLTESPLWRQQCQVRKASRQASSTNAAYPMSAAH